MNEVPMTADEKKHRDLDLIESLKDIEAKIREEVVLLEAKREVIIAAIAELEAWKGETK